MGIVKGLATLAVGALAGAAVFAGVNMYREATSGAPDFDKVGDYTSTAKNVVRFKLAPSNDKLAKCMPKVKVDVAVALETDAKGFDVLDVKMSGAPASTSFTVFLLEVPGAPFGAAEYIGDVNTDKYGNGKTELRLIVEEAFSSTIVGKERVRKELNHMGMWFADPKDDDFCLGADSPVTPFDGDNEAGVQAFNSAPSLPKAPLP
ncbi:hypothetical protein GCM10022255_047650 [Dactylosporangium darangshiense]|uniref:SipW-cognate class signal peptide n=1 Tax=Dactylosporangium darangshiense TaxID=579108 RepID=A0ABP8DBS1_9ACTN